MNNIEIFGLSGKVGSGKNYVAENILCPMLTEKNTVVLSFADHFKIDAIAKDKIKYEEVFIKKTKESRVALQKRGTEEGRDVYGPMVWVDVLTNWIRVLSERGVQRVIIGDVRFKSEAQAIKELGGLLIRVNSPQRNLQKLMQESGGDQTIINQISSHVSEIELDEYEEFDLVLDNDENPDLFNEVRDFVRGHNKKQTHNLVVFCDLDNTLCECKKYYDVQKDSLLKVLLVYKAKNITENEFNTKFEALYTLIEGGYQQFAFTRDRFPLSLKSIVNEMKPYMTVSGDLLETLYEIALRIGYSVFDYNYEPLGNALDVVKELSTEYKVVLVTMGNYLEQKKKIAQLGLTYIDSHVTVDKNQSTFQTLMEKYPSDCYIMVGDSLHRDIIPAINAGVDKAYWIGGQPDVVSEYSKNIICIQTIEEVKSYLTDESSF